MCLLIPFPGKPHANCKRSSTTAHCIIMTVHNSTYYATNLVNFRVIPLCSIAHCVLIRVICTKPLHCASRSIKHGSFLSIHQAERIHCGNCCITNMLTTIVCRYDSNVSSTLLQLTEDNTALPQPLNVRYTECKIPSAQV